MELFLGETGQLPRSFAEQSHDKKMRPRVPDVSITLEMEKRSESRVPDWLPLTGSIFIASASHQVAPCA